MISHMNVLHVLLLSEPSVKLLVTIQKHGMTIWMLWCLVSEQKKENDHWNTHPITWFLAEARYPYEIPEHYMVFLSVTNYRKILRKAP